VKYPVIQNRTYATPKAARRTKTGDFALGISSTTGHVTNIAFDPSRIVYEKSYNNAQTHSAIFQRHLNTVADYVAANFRDKKVVEIGCGDGTFLKLLSERGLSAIGFDPSSSTASDRIFPRTFSPGEVEADVFILRHVLEHIHHPELFLARLASRHPAADLVVEVPDLDWTQQNNAWFDFYYEHVNYFDSQSLTNLFAGRFRFKRVFGNQYLMGIGNLADLSTGDLASNKSALRRLEAAQQCIRTAREEILRSPLKHLW